MNKTAVLYRIICMHLLYLESIWAQNSGWSDDEFDAHGDCEYAIEGPFTQACLNSMWVDAGCLMTGTKFPQNVNEEQIAWWNDRSYLEVKADMELYYRYAMNQYQDYPMQCFGDESKRVCGFKRYPGQALYGLNDMILSSSSVEACAKRCDGMNYGECKSFEFKQDSDICFISSSNRITDPDSFGAHDFLDYYERVCGDEASLVINDTYKGDVPGEVIDKEGHCFIKYGPVGSNGGYFFDDFYDYHNQPIIMQIGVRYGGLIDAIQIVYGGGMGHDSPTPLHGGSGGTLFWLNLNSTEYITGITGSAGPYVRALTFVTNKRVVGPFGYPLTGTKFNINTKDKRLAYISGQSASYLDQITFYFEC